MFQGKVVIYKNIDGKEQKVEKTFDNPSDYNYFIQNNTDIKSLKTVTDTMMHSRGEFSNYMENLFENKLGQIKEYMDESMPAIVDTVKARTPTLSQAPAKKAAIKPAKKPTPAKKTAPQKPTAKPAAKKPAPKKPAAKKTAPKKPMPMKKAPAKKPAPKKVAKKPVAKKRR